MRDFPDASHELRQQGRDSIFSINSFAARRLDNVFDVFLDFFRGHRLRSLPGCCALYNPKNLITTCASTIAAAMPTILLPAQIVSSSMIFLVGTSTEFESCRVLFQRDLGSALLDADMNVTTEFTFLFWVHFPAFSLLVAIISGSPLPTKDSLSKYASSMPSANSSFLSNALSIAYI